MTGLVGKLPAHGDFVRRGGPAPVLAAIDRWLDMELTRAPELAGDIDGLDGWRFAGTIAGCPILLAMIASGDAVGRAFPAIAVIDLPAGGAPAPDEADRWCSAAGTVLRAARDDGSRADHVATALAAIAPPARAESAGGTGWWRDGGTPDGDAALPAGEDFVRLFAGPVR